MSRVYFHSQHGTAELHGSERVWAGWLCSETACTILELYAERYDEHPNPQPHLLESFVPADSYVRYGSPGRRLNIRATRTAFAVGSLDLALPDGTTASVFSVGLSTALVAGSDPIKLLARIHGQCELHAYVEDANRDWLAGIIDEGRKANIFRAQQGWEEVAALLRAPEPGPVVMSYSVCESFPGPHCADWEMPLVMVEDDDGKLVEEPDHDAWYNLPEDERWTLSLSALRAGKMGRHLELTPETWDGYTFRSGLSAFDIRALAEAQG